ncbi:MAG: DNA alkylation repair protein [Candidatus Thorarchaeota archaeon]|nr:DNA alkylation repair protein [Candidatus Thorarchaeota archaeon]
MKHHVTGWGSCDDLCTHTIGYFILEYPKFIPAVKQWVHSDNPFVRRAAPVSLIYALRRGKLFEHAFDLANRLMNDENKYVLKGYGWMLKVASKHHQDEVFEYIMKNRARMPRLSLRYAIEKMAESLKKAAMAPP